MSTNEAIQPCLRWNSDSRHLVFVTKNFYRDQLGDLMLPKLNIAVAAIFYAFFVVAIVILAVLPRFEAGSCLVAIGYGAMLGLDAYGAYDMTNLSTIGGWPVLMSIVDLIWGTMLTGLASACGYLAARHLDS